MSAVVVESAVGRVEVAGGLLSRAVGWVQSAAAGAGDRAVHLTGVRLIVGPSVRHPRVYSPGWGRVPVSAGYAVTVAATDRYRLAVATIELPEVDGGLAPDVAVTVPRAELVAAVKSWGRQPAFATVTVGVEQDRAASLVRVETAVPVMTSVTMRSVEGSFPDVGRLLPEFDGVEHGPVQLGFNAAFLQDFAAAARKVDRDATLLLAGSCPDKAFGVQVHAPGSPLYCYGLLMPVRPGR